MENEQKVDAPKETVGNFILWLFVFFGMVAFFVWAYESSQVDTCYTFIGSQVIEMPCTK